MSRQAFLLLAAVIVSPAAAYLVYRAAKELGFLDPPANREQALRREILAAIYALLVFLPVFLFGWERRFPRVWVAFGVVTGAALVFFAVGGAMAARALWKLRRDAASVPEPSEHAPLPRHDF